MFRVDNFSKKHSRGMLLYTGETGPIEGLSSASHYRGDACAATPEQHQDAAGAGQAAGFPALRAGIKTTDPAHIIRRSSEDRGEKALLKCTRDRKRDEGTIPFPVTFG